MHTLHPIAGIRLASGSAGIKKNNQQDLVIIELCEKSQVSAVFTQNAFCAAPVSVAKRHLKSSAPRYLIINSGNANAGTGQQGIIDAVACCKALGELMGCDFQQVLPFSTGVIGQDLPVKKICDVIPSITNKLQDSGWQDAAHGILTTDTVPKAISKKILIEDHEITLTGIAKGSGMICPNMATLLAYVATDACIDPELQQQCLHNAISRSFNNITVDGDTSTNDACLLISTGQSSLPIIDTENSDAYRLLSDAIESLCEDLAKALVRDAEGATKFVTIKINGGVNVAECEIVAYAIAHSPLVKTALFASDPNWGRILAAIGRAGIKNLDIQKINICLDDVCIVQNGQRAADYNEVAGQKVMDREDISIIVDLGRGTETTKVWTCDLSYDYVRINAEYRT
jgi:glutamate N-acetyltransferase/amino-acid N-acetyltransferase